jgi:hypothetical protein
MVHFTFFPRALAHTPPNRARTVDSRTPHHPRLSFGVIDTVVTLYTIYLARYPSTTMWLPLTLLALLAALASHVNAVPAKFVPPQTHPFHRCLQYSALNERKVDFEWGTTEVRGVNIGGWLVLEP